VEGLKVSAIGKKKERKRAGGKRSVPEGGAYMAGKAGGSL